MPSELTTDVASVKGGMEQIRLDPAIWPDWPSIPHLDWQYVQLRPGAIDSVPHQRGVYAFLVQPATANMPMLRYLLYIGITGIGKRNSFRRRLAEYFREQRSKRGRPKVQYFMARWEGHLCFAYAAVPDRRRNLETIETAILDAIDPPFNDRDFSIRLGRARRAL